MTMASQINSLSSVIVSKAKCFNVLNAERAIYSRETSEQTFFIHSSIFAYVQIQWGLQWISRQPMWSKFRRKGSLGSYTFNLSKKRMI